MGGIGSDAAWKVCYKEDGPQPILQEDGVTEKNEHIVEFQTILQAISCNAVIEAKEKCPNKVWIGGKKCTFIASEIDTGTNSEFSFKKLTLSGKNEKGWIVVFTDGGLTGKGCVLIAGYDKQNKCPPSYAGAVAIDFAKWLKDSGTDQSW